MAYARRCPFCERYATMNESNYTSSLFAFNNENKYGIQVVSSHAATCPNPSCREYSFDVTIYDAKKGTSQPDYAAVRHVWRLVPPSAMRTMPDYVPVPIVEDYKEACLIAALSPKASATLSRRALQGMIRDYWGIANSRLFDEIAAIKDKVDGDTWKAIDAVRQIGNIGAHMEKDVKVIVDVDPDEAKLLIGLIETLVDDWYVARHDRAHRMTALAALAAKKQQERKDGGQPPADGAHGS
jgi:hypothetical protein